MSEHCPLLCLGNRARLVNYKSTTNSRSEESMKSNTIRNICQVTEIAVLLIVSCVCGHAHEEPVHQQITRSAFNSSDGIQAFLSQLLPAANSPFTDLPLLP